MIRFVYVAGPITKGDQAVNVRRGIDAGHELMAAGLHPFVPHLSWFSHFVHATDYEDWLAYDFAWLQRCDALVRLPGESAGADREAAEARRLGLPVFEGVGRLLAFVVAETQQAAS